MKSFNDIFYGIGTSVLTTLSARLRRWALAGRRRSQVPVVTTDEIPPGKEARVSVQFYYCMALTSFTVPPGSDFTIVAMRFGCEEIATELAGDLCAPGEGEEHRFELPDVSPGGIAWLSVRNDGDRPRKFQGSFWGVRTTIYGL